MHPLLEVGAKSRWAQVGNGGGPGQADLPGEMVEFLENYIREHRFPIYLVGQANGHSRTAGPSSCIQPYL